MFLTFLLSLLVQIRFCNHRKIGHENAHASAPCLQLLWTVVAHPCTVLAKMTILLTTLDLWCFVLMHNYHRPLFFSILNLLYSSWPWLSKLLFHNRCWIHSYICDTHLYVFPVQYTVFITAKFGQSCVPLLVHNFTAVFRYPNHYTLFLCCLPMYVLTWFFSLLLTCIL